MRIPRGCEWPLTYYIQLGRLPKRIKTNPNAHGSSRAMKIPSAPTLPSSTEDKDEPKRIYCHKGNGELTCQKSPTGAADPNCDQLRNVKKDPTFMKPATRFQLIPLVSSCARTTKIQHLRNQSPTWPIPILHSSSTNVIGNRHVTSNSAGP